MYKRIWVEFQKVHLKFQSKYYTYQGLIQWNLYKATTKFCGLLRQVSFHDRENKHDFVKIVPGKWWNLCVFSKTSMAVRGNKIFGALAPKQMFLIYSIQNSTRPGQFFTRPAQNAVALASGRALVCLTARSHYIYLKIIACLTSMILHFSIQIIHDFKESFAQIHLPGWLFYVPQAIGQWNILSPAYWKVTFFYSSLKF